MAEHTIKDIWNDNDGAGKREVKKSRSVLSFVAFGLILLLVLGVVLLAAYRDGTGFDVLRRFLNYGRAESVGGEAIYDYDASTQNRFVVLGDRLAVLSDTSLKLLSRDGKELWSTTVKMSSPALVCGGDRAVAYGVGGTQLYVMDEKGLLRTLETSEEEAFLTVTVNHAGWLAVTTEDPNYKSCVTVYNNKLEKVFRFQSSRRFAVDGYVTDDCKMLAAVTLGQENSVFVSNILLYDLSQQEPVADYDVSDGLVFEIGEMGGMLATVADTSLTFADHRGKVNGVYAYPGEFLREYSLDADGFAALLLNRYQSGSVGRLVTVGTDGTEIATLDISGEVQSMSACGRYLAVLYLDSLVIYNQNLEVYASLQGTRNAREVLVRPDGSALLLSAEEATIFLP